MLQGMLLHVERQLCHQMRGNSNNSKDEHFFLSRAKLFNIYCFLFC